MESRSRHVFVGGSVSQCALSLCAIHEHKDCLMMFNGLIVSRTMDTPAKPQLLRTK